MVCFDIFTYQHPWRYFRLFTWHPFYGVFSVARVVSFFSFSQLLRDLIFLFFFLLFHFILYNDFFSFLWSERGLYILFCLGLRNKISLGSDGSLFPKQIQPNDPKRTNPPKHDKRSPVASCAGDALFASPSWPSPWTGRCLRLPLTGMHRTNARSAYHVGLDSALADF